MGSVCVNGRCGFREKSERRDCPKCGWLMLDGPLPATGSLTPPPRHLSLRSFVPAIAAGGVLFLGAVGMAAGSLASSDPVTAASAHAAPAPAVASVEETPVAPVATAAPVVAAPAPEAAKRLASAAKPAAKKVAAKKAKKPVARKSAAKKPAKKVVKKTVARR